MKALQPDARRRAELTQNTAMNEDSETLRLDHADNVASIRERLARMRGVRVLLILPEDGALFRRKLDLVLVQREAHLRAIQLALVSRDPRVLGNAQELNISCFDSLADSQSARWKRGRHKVFLPRHHKPDPNAQPEDLRLIASRIDTRERRHSRWWLFIERAAVLAILFSVVGTVIYVIAPSAVVEVTLRQETLTAEIEIVADVDAAALDIGGAIMPAQRVQALAEARASVPASGLRNIGDISATGFVTFTNRTGEPVVIPANTVLSTSAGEPVLFRTIAEAAAPAGSENHAEAPVVALERFSGNVGNVAAGMINTVVGPLADDITVINLAPTAGGEARTVRVVDANDLALLRERARARLLTAAYELISVDLSNAQVIVIDSLRIEDEHKDWTDFSAEVGDVANEVTVTMRASVTAVVLDESLSRQIATSRLRDLTPSGAAILSDTIRYGRGPVSWQPARNQARFVARAKGSAVARVETSQLREQLAGLSLGDAAKLIESQVEVAGGVTTKIDLFPSSLGRMPSLPIRISLDVLMPT